MYVSMKVGTQWVEIDFLYIFYISLGEFQKNKLEGTPNLKLAIVKRL